ncbi:MAG: hemerythrin family protein [Helicobacteraceae bacterium]|nr:hemerythrin family protein [Helicobacteraceae bacterium]
MVEWSNQYVLGVCSMDETHKEFVRILNNAIAAVNNSDFYEHCQEILHHTYNHFEGERLMMVDCGVSSRQDHIVEHNRVLAEMEHMFARPKEAKKYVMEGIPAWFHTHATTLDSELARAILEKQKT